jgi:hypothetical protein
MAPSEANGPNECCGEKDRLERTCRIATADYNRAVQVLQHYTGSMLREEYERLRKFSEEARLKSEQARLELDRHTAEHGC